MGPNVRRARALARTQADPRKDSKGTEGIKDVRFIVFQHFIVDMPVECAAHLVSLIRSNCNGV